MVAFPFPPSVSHGILGYVPDADSFMTLNHPTNTDPFGNADTCNPANEDLLDLIRLAGEAWYSTNPEHKIQHEITYRKLRNSHGRFYHLRECNYGYYFAELRELRTDEKGNEKEFLVTICGYDETEQMPWRCFSRLLDRKLPSGLSVGSNRTLFGENFTAYNDSSPFLHRCRDETTKELVYEAGGEKLQVIASKNSVLFKGEENKIASRMLQGFLNNQRVNQGLAFDHLEQLIYLQRHRLMYLPTKKEKRIMQSTLKWFEYASQSGYYFRKISEDKIEQYDPGPKKRVVIVRPPSASFASLTHRKLRIYGFARGGETQTI